MKVHVELSHRERVAVSAALWFILHGENAVWESFSRHCRENDYGAEEQFKLIHAFYDRLVRGLDQP